MSAKFQDILSIIGFIWGCIATSIAGACAGFGNYGLAVVFAIAAIIGFAIHAIFRG